MTVVDPSAPAPAPAFVDAAPFRLDIDGLRAIAIILVVAFHAKVAGFDGGFIGVDVFFVISGWLITRNIIRESEQTGQVDVARFWARRIRRLVPGLALVIAATMVGSILILSHFEIDQVADAGLAAALYVSNFFFADQSQGYFAADISQSPFLHTWSLGVEEQFYLVWPLLVGALVFAVRRRPRALRHVLGLAFGGLLVGSFAISWSLTGKGSTWAFYGLPSRAWEFAAAGLLATVGVPAVLTRFAARVVAGVGGLALLGTATLMHSAATPYPGTAALLPVVGTLALIVSGDLGGSSDRPTPVGRFLSTRPLQHIGRLSYSWYLWHWPVLVLATVAFDRTDVGFRLVAVGAALPMAWVAYRFVENPVRFSWAFVRPNGRTYLFGAGLTAVAATFALGGAGIVSALPAPRIELQLEQAASLKGRFPDCEQLKTKAGDGYCEGGDRSGDHLVMIVGDSKALGWFNTLASVSKVDGTRLVGSFATGCPAIDVDIINVPFVAMETCRLGRSSTRRLIQELEPDVVVVSEGSLYLGLGDVLVDGQVPSKDGQASRWGDAFEAMIRELRAGGAKVAVILDNPAYDNDPNLCIARAGSVATCELSRRESLAIIGSIRERELDVVDKLDVVHFDATDALCGVDTCSLGTRDYLHYFDSNHLSRQSMEAMKSDLADMVGRARGR